MANLSELTADAYKAAQVVSRERVGYCNAALMNTGDTVAALGSNISSMYAPPVSTVDLTPGSVLPNATDQTLEQRSLPVDKLKGVPIRWSGEQVRRQGQTVRGASGQTYETVLGAQIEQAVRALVNGIETSVAEAVLTATGYAVGTAGTTPFASDADLLADARGVLDQVGAPEDGLCVVAGNAAVGNLRKLDEYTKGDTVNTDMGTFRTGMLADIHGMKVYQSGQVDRNRGAASTPHASQQLNGAAAVGDTSLTIDGGNGALVDGAFVQLGTGGTYYGVNAKAAAGTSIGLKARLLDAQADNLAVDAVAAHVRNTAFHMNAIEIAVRPPMPGNDLSTNAIVIQDGVSGIVFRLAEYPGFLEHQFYVQAVYGVRVWQPEHVVAILG